jgi:hypothetical protein
MTAINTLPLVEIEAQFPDPNWIGQYETDDRGNRIAINWDSYYIKETVQAEVLALNLNKGTMRVRYTINGKVRTPDVSIAPFFAKFQITEL